MHTQNRAEALLEIIRQSLLLSAAQNSSATLGDRTKYLGISEIARFAECPRAAALDRIKAQEPDVRRILTLERGHWFENGIRQALSGAGLNFAHQLEIGISRDNYSIKAHLDFTLVWTKPILAVRILEVKSVNTLPDAPYESHSHQAQAQVDLLQHYWNEPVFSLKNEQGQALVRAMTFPQLSMAILGMDIGDAPEKVSIESWLLYLSMQNGRAFGPYAYNPESLENLFQQAGSLQASINASENKPDSMCELPFPKGFHPLCGSCDFNADCPKFRDQGYQTQWEPALVKLDRLKHGRSRLEAKISDIEDALKQAHELAGTKDWINTGNHRFRVSRSAGRRSLNKDLLRDNLVRIFREANLEVDIDALFAACEKESAPYSRLSISAIN